MLVTFTEKAAGEIADRIHQALDRARRCVSSPATALSGRSAPPRRCSKCRTDQRDAYRRACIAQLARIDVAPLADDPFVLPELLRQFPIEAGLDPQFKIIEGFERSLLYGELYDAWVDDETRLHPTAEAKREWEVLLEHVGYLFLVREIDLAAARPPRSPARRDLRPRRARPSSTSCSIAHRDNCAAAMPIPRHLRLRARASSPPRGSTIDDVARLPRSRSRTRSARRDLPRGKVNEHCKQPLRVLRARTRKGHSVYDRLSVHRAAVSLLALTRRFVAFLEEEKRKLGVVDFDDLLLRTLTRARRSGGAASACASSSTTSSSTSFRTPTACRRASSTGSRATATAQCVAGQDDHGRRSEAVDLRLPPRRSGDVLRR